MNVIAVLGIVTVSSATEWPSFVQLGRLIVSVFVILLSSRTALATAAVTGAYGESCYKLWVVIM